MAFKKLLLIISAVFLLSSCMTTVGQKYISKTKITENELNNGLFYSIHSKPENSGKVQLRLMINSGSLSETDEQSGYAHLIEHMAFNGTEHFSKNKIIDLFEESGLTFGHDINAYTKFSETVYKLSIPKSNKKLLAKTLLYFHDILTSMSFDKVELEKEKGVVENEYQISVLDEKYYSDAIFDDYIKGSPYAHRLPIGKLDSIQNSTTDSLNDFYKRWYRPNNAKLLISGDVDTSFIEQLVVDTFSVIKKSKSNELQSVPNTPSLNTQTQAYTSKVIDLSETDAIFELPSFIIKNSQDLSVKLRFDLLQNLINERLNTANAQQNTPFSRTGFHIFSLLKSKRVGDIYVEHLDGEHALAAKFIAQEVARIKQHGFSQQEYTQQLKLLKSSQDKLFDYYINRDSQDIAADVMSAWLSGNVEYNFKLENRAYQIVLKTTLAEVNRLAKEQLKQPMKLTTAFTYQSNTPNLLASNEIFINTLEQTVPKREIQKKKLILPVIEKQSGDEKIVKETFYSNKKITQWQLNNDVDVVLQPDHRIKNEIYMHFSAPGGLNTLNDKDLIASKFLINSYIKSGLMGLSAQVLKQRLEEKNIDIIPFIKGHSAGFIMNSVNNSDSLTLLFSMLYSSVTNASVDENVFLSEKKNVIEQQENSFKSPVIKFYDAVTDSVFPDNSRQKPASIEQLQSIQKGDVEALYQKLFSTANGYKLTIVGDFNIAKIKPLILHYIASLPTGRLHKFAETPQSLISKPTQLKKAINPQNTAIVLWNIVTNTPNKGIKPVYQAKLLQRILSKKLTQIVREKLSLTYSPYVSVYDQPPGLAFTNTMINLTTKVKDVQKTQLIVDDIIDNLLNIGITQQQLDEQKKSVKMNISTLLGESSNKEEFLHRDHLFGYTLGSTEDTSRILDDITVEDMNQFIKVYLAPQKTLRAVNLPE